MSENNKRAISVRKARLHNLKDIDVDIPRNKLTVITGVSGSGKSSLAFDTIYAEGQRRFVESLSSYARQFLERMSKPDCDSISGIPPAIAIQQNTFTKNPRSTVGTTTEIYDYLRILFGRIGTTICYGCNKPVQRDSSSSVLKEIQDMKEGDRIYITFTPDTRNFNPENYYLWLRENGFFRLIDKKTNEIVEIDNDNNFKITNDNFLVLVDRVVIQNDNETITRIGDSLDIAFNSGNGSVQIINLNKDLSKRYSSIFECADCEIVYEEPEPKLFSFNNPYGACPKCQGFGRTVGIDEDLVIPDRTKSIKKGAVHPFKNETTTKYQMDVLKMCTVCGIDPDKPYSELTEAEMQKVWEGDKRSGYDGINGFFEMVEEKSYKMAYRVLISRYRGYTKCRACGGSRLRTSARQVFIDGKNIPELVLMPLDLLLDYFKNIKLTEYQINIAGQLLNEIVWRLGLLVEIGLEYLNLSRLSHTLSGGESQRINLSTALGSSLVGTLYVLDEPSIGLHPRDTGRLINILFKLRNLGNTVIVVEHDPDIIKKADYLIDIGPYAGSNGGEVVFAGEFKNLSEAEKSITAKYLTGQKKIELPQIRRNETSQFITIHKPRENNIKIERLDIPLNCIVVVTGVSGSGKSTLIHDVLYSSLKKATSTSYQGNVGKVDLIEGYYGFKNIEMIDQSRIGLSSRSTPATYTKAFDYVRDLFSQTQAAKQLNWKPGHFSFNVPGGRCDVCEGEGYVTVDMQFLPDVTLVCESCKGSRYKREVHNILYKGKSVVDVLNMTIEEAYNFFSDTPRIQSKFQTLIDVGLGYLQLGQPSSMLSGGESQRIKLASHLELSDEDKTLFIFDEPTTGLHLDDISKLIYCFDKLVEAGHSVIIIEHNLSVIASADYIIDLGPEAGEKGGNITGLGTPEAIAELDTHTGKALKEYLKNGVILQFE